MKKYIFAILSTAFIGFSACSEDTLDEINKDDHNPTPDVVPASLQLADAILSTGYSTGTTALLPPDKFFSNLPNFNLKSGADTQSRTGDLTLTKGALYQLSHISTLNLMPGSSLLSHGETPHYHRRYGVSLLSSAWGQVGPPRYGRQANSVLSDRFCVLI